MIKTLPDYIEDDELHFRIKEFRVAGIAVDEFTVRVKRRRKRISHVIAIAIGGQPYMSHPGGQWTYYIPSRNGRRVWVKTPYERLRYLRKK